MKAIEHAPLRHSLEPDCDRRAGRAEKRALGRLLAPGEGSMTEPRDGNQVAASALSRKRAEIAGIIAELEKTLAERRADLVHIDNALRLLNSPIPGEAIPARKPRPKNTGYFVHGVSAAEIADLALADKGIEDKGVRATFVARFLVRLGQMALRGTIERIGGGNGCVGGRRTPQSNSQRDQGGDVQTVAIRGCRPAAC